MCLAHDWHAKSQDKMERASFCECLTSKAFARDTCKTFYFAKLSYLIHTFCTHTIYTPITHKPWELEIVIPTILYTIHCAFCSTLTSPFSYPWEVDSPNTYHTQTLTTPILSVKWGFGAVGKHWKKPSFGGCNRAYCGIQRARQDTVSRSLVGVRAWRA